MQNVPYLYTNMINLKICPFLQFKTKVVQEKTKRSNETFCLNQFYN